MPPVDIGSLTAYVRHKQPGWHVETWPTFLEAAADITVSTYESIAQEAEKNCIGDSVFTAMLYPERVDRAQAHFDRSVRKMPPVWSALADLPVAREAAFGYLHDRLDAHFDQVLDRLIESWSRSSGHPLVLGLTTTYTQLFSSIEFARRVKRRRPDVRIVLGGTNVSASMGPTVMAEYEWIDYVVQGEGEGPLLALLRDLERDVARDISGVLSRTQHDAASEMSQLPSLEELPPPDYNVYYDAPLIRDQPQWAKAIAIEASRGCVHRCSPARGGRV